MKKRRILILTLVLTLFLSSYTTFNFFLLQEQNTALDNCTNICQTEYKCECENQISGFVVQASRIVYGTRTGRKYHRSGCRYLRLSKIRMTRSRARSLGLTPCSVCRP